ncbi:MULTISPECIES: GntR family transcriptional regulator [Thalassospira]|uniref:GntR family transcriptional regulator n=1 Tax=Thalassospira aquimaris TaxID=3037796 RepID=A0ABT6G767_9PROT|nr:MULTISPECIES: GntR family transcriptional regulator [Thalassospira]MDG4717843.1 GntR family transcriptional regulator [Thalassospira sp. FZY0004]
MSVVPNQLHIQLAQRILLFARTSGLEAGHHFTETSLQHLLGTSRGPIRAALNYLSDQGFLEKRPNRGFFLLSVPNDALDRISDAPEADDERIYLAIAADRLASTLEEKVTEAELMRRYDVPRYSLRRVLGRISSEGWIERKAGNGWLFLPMIDSVEAYRESYALRQILEPAGLQAEGFKANITVLKHLKTQQEFIHDKGFETLGQIELFEANSQFHESLAEMSGNRFLAQSVAKQNQLRRLVEYRQTIDRARVKRQTEQHLEIIDALLTGNNTKAAELLRRHIGGASEEKAQPNIFSSRS